MNLVSVYHNFGNMGGAQAVALNLAEALEPGSVVLTGTPPGSIAAPCRTRNVRFGPFSIKEILKHRDCVFLSHDRKSTTRLCALSRALRLRLRIIHVAHNSFNSLRHFTLFPPEIVAVSDSVAANLRDYFRIAPDRIHVIDNGIADRFKALPDAPQPKERIDILWPARVCPVKRQLETVRAIKDSMPPGVAITFAGDGEDLAALKAETDGHPSFRVLGHVDIDSIIADYDYVCLFSEKEGLALSLLEGCMYGLPLISNDIAPALLVNEHGVTGFVYDTFDHLAAGLGRLPHKGSDHYARLAAAARRKYLENYTFDRMVESYRSLINKYLKNASEN